ncbi:MAG: sulfite exporter TauE/SafE family protein [Candidatus Kerfeldbacteria bacterium]|jgi:sulfite exporter TauE/SafE
MDIEIVRLLPVLGLGFILGLEHALDADHVVAVTTIVSETKSFKKSSLMGMVWGIGHTATLMMVALLVLIFKLNIPNRLAMSMEFIVGIVLILLGVNVLWKIYQHKIHVHTHKHGGEVHTHFHSHQKSKAHSHLHTSLLMGMVHGLAGSAALMLLVLATLPSVTEGIIYVLIFGAGSVLGMMIISSLIGLPFILSMKIKKINSIIKFSAGFISIVLGLMIMYQIGFVDGLLKF